MPATSGVYIPVGGLTWSSGAGTEVWGLRTHAAWSSRVVKHRYAVGTVYGYRSSTTSDHSKRIAADFMVYSNSTKGYQIAEFAKKHYRELNALVAVLLATSILRALQELEEQRATTGDPTWPWK